MRVLQVHKDFEPRGGGGGTARHIAGLSRALAELGAEVRVACPAPEAVTEPYVTVTASPGQLRPHVAWADVVHVHGARSTYAVIGGALAALSGRPFFYTPHAYYNIDGPLNTAAKAVWDRSAESFLAWRGAGTILLTDVWRDYFRARGMPTANTVIIPNCVLAADLPPPLPRAGVPQLPGAPAILTVGRLEAVKRVGDVVAALACPELAAAHLHVVGKGSDRDAIAARAAALGVAERITLHGFVDDAGVARMVAGADVFVLASEQEGLPTVLLEMLIARLPVVATRIPGNLAIMDAAGLTTTCAVGDIPALAARLAATARSTVPEAAVAAVLRTFTWEARAPELHALYATAIAARRARH